MNDKHYLTVKQAAEALQVCTKTMRSLLAANAFPYIRAGRKYLIPSTAIFGKSQTPP
jgi:excisionase family DNA binding protein